MQKYDDKLEVLAHFYKKEEKNVVKPFRIKVVQDHEEIAFNISVITTTINRDSFIFDCKAIINQAEKQLRLIFHIEDELWNLYI